MLIVDALLRKVIDVTNSAPNERNVIVVVVKKFEQRCSNKCENISWYGYIFQFQSSKSFQSRAINNGFEKEIVFH